MDDIPLINVKCAIYARVSTEKQAERNISIPDQIEQARNYANLNGWDVVAEYIDPGGSGRSDAKRPQFRSMIAEALSHRHPFDYILVYNFARFYRDHVLSELLRRDLKKNQIEVRSLTQEIRDDGQGGTFALAVLGIVDEYQSRINSRSVRDTMAANARAGFRNGGSTPFGYRLEKAGEAGGRAKNKLAIDDITGPIAKKVFSWAASGTGCLQIAAALNAEGIRTYRGHKWSVSSINYLLKNETYAGRSYFKGRDAFTGKTMPRSEWISVPCPALVSEDMFRSVQERMRERRPTVTPPRITTSPVLLAGIALCGSCCRPMQLATGTSGTGRVYRYYKCSGKIIEGSCEGGAPASVREDKLDAIVMECLLEKLLTADRVGSIVREVHKQNNSDRKGSEGHLRQLKINLSRVEREESNLWDLAAKLGLQVAEGFRTKAASLENERDTLQRGISEIQECIFQRISHLTSNDVAKVTGQLRDLISSTSITIRRRFFRSFVSAVVVAPSEAKIFGPKLALAQAAFNSPSANRPKPPVRGFKHNWPTIFSADPSTR